MLITGRRGITLVEVLLAVAILSIGMVGVLRAYAVSIGALEISRDTINIIELLKEKMADIEQTTIEQGGVSAGASSGKFEGTWEDYAWASQTNTIAQEGLCELALTVSSQLDGSRQASLVTYEQNKDYQK